MNLLAEIHPGIVYPSVVLFSFVLVYLAAAVSRRQGMVDVPGDRQSHTVPTVTGGGIGLIAALVISSLVVMQGGSSGDSWTIAVLPGLVLLSLVGWFDDRRPLSNKFRLFVQLIVSFGLLACLEFKGWQISWPIFLLGGLAMVWVMNFYNFMDGSHGMAGFQGVFSGLLLGMVYLTLGEPSIAVPAFLLAAVCAGFLPQNFPRPLVFMGDSGSVPLGFAIAALLTLGISRQLIGIPVALLVLAVFLVDSSLTLFNRAIRGEQWYTAHRQHMYQRLIGQGWTHNRVLFLYQAVNIILIVPVVMLVLMYPEHAWLLTGSVFLLLTAGWYLASLRIGVRK